MEKLKLAKLKYLSDKKELVLFTTKNNYWIFIETNGNICVCGRLYSFEAQIKFYINEFFERIKENEIDCVDVFRNKFANSIYRKDIEFFRKLYKKICGI